MAREWIIALLVLVAGFGHDNYVLAMRLQATGEVRRLHADRRLQSQCPLGRDDPIVKNIQDAAIEYEETMSRYEQGEIDGTSMIPSDPDVQEKWFAGLAPELVENWKELTIQAKFNSAMGDTRIKASKAFKKVVSQIWENPDESRGSEAMWNGRFWRNRAGGFSGWSSKFGTVVSGTQTVTATSVPFLGVNRQASESATFNTTYPSVCGEGHGALSTALRSGWCGGKKSKGAAKQAWKDLIRLPANVYLTTYLSSTGGINHRKQVRTGSLAYGLEGKDGLMSEAASTLSDVVKYALAIPPEVATAKPRVRFTQLMAFYVSRIFHNESKFTEDQMSVIGKFKQRLANEGTKLTYKVNDEEFARLQPEDVVELRYAANAWGVNGTFREDKKFTRQVNMPAFFTYLRWIANDLGELMRDEGLSIYLGMEGEAVIRSGTFVQNEPSVWDEYCYSSEPIWVDLADGGLLTPDWLLDEGVLAKTIRDHLSGVEKLKHRTKRLQCWSRSLRIFSTYLVKDGKPISGDSEAGRKLQKLQVALDMLFQLQVQAKRPKKEGLACGGKCAPSHRTAELLQIAVLDTMLGVLTFSNCKSGLDRTGIYHAVQSAVDQLHILYPHCTQSLAFVAIHFPRLVAMATSQMNSSAHTSHADRLKTWTQARVRRTANLQCGHTNPLHWDKRALTNASDGAVHMFDIMRNAVLKNLLEVGMKITFSSTGVAGLKYAGYTGEYVAKKCAEHRKSKKDPSAPCDAVEADLVLGAKNEANPMVAPFLPNWVSFGSSSNTKVMALTRSHEGELYIASDLADASEQGLKNPMTASALLQDASHLRQS